MPTGGQKSSWKSITSNAGLKIAVKSDMVVRREGGKAR